MTFEPPPAPPVPPPGPGRTRWRLNRLQKAAIAGGTAVGLALGGAGIAFAASSSTTTPSAPKPSTTTPAAPPAGPLGPGMGPRFGHAFGGPGGLGRFADAVHGQVTVPTGTNSYKTIEFQVGTVRSKSTSSITVRSADGYTHTYAVTAATVVDAQRDGIGSVVTNDTVRVLATPVGGKDTATSIVDTTKIGASRSGFGFPSAPRTGSAGSAWFGEGHSRAGATPA